MTFVKNKFFIIFIIIALIAGIVIAKKMTKSTENTVVVTTQKDTAIYGTGTLEAKEIVVLAPKTTAKLQELYVDEGDSVRTNQVLAKMEISELRGTLQESTASLAKSKSQLAAQKALIDDLEAKKSLSDVTLARYTTLLKGGFVTQAEFDNAQTSARSASAQLIAARENMSLAVHDIEKSHASMSAQQSKIDDLVLRSPFDGIVLSRNAEAGSTVGAGVAVFRLANPKTVWVKIYIDEGQSASVKVGQTASVSLRSSAQTPFKGEVVRIGVESDRVTEERIVYIKLLDAPELLHIGEQADAKINIDTRP